MLTIDKLKAQEEKAKQLLTQTKRAIKTLQRQQRQEAERQRRARCLAIGTLVETQLGEVSLDIVHAMVQLWQATNRQNGSRPE